MYRYSTQPHGCLMDTRELKALEIAARCKLTCKDGVWFVPSQSGSGVYQVTFGSHGFPCPCDDFSLRQKPCKPATAAFLVAERDGLEKAPAIDTDTPPVRK